MPTSACKLCWSRFATAALALLALLTCSIEAAATVPTSTLIHLDWDGCTINATSNRDFACDTDAGEDVLVASYTALDLPEPPTWFTFSIWFQTSTDQPSWWQTYPGGCRAGAIYTDEVVPASSTCTHFPSSMSFINQTSMSSGVNISGGIQLAQPSPPELLVPGETYFLFNMRVQHTKTAAADSCSGCGQAVWVFFRELKLLTATVGLQYTFDGFVTPKATWQIPAQVPTRNTTWGRVKGQYR